MKKSVKIVFMLAVLMLILSLCCFGASALEATGKCGDNVYWTFDKITGELVISGSGKMYDYEADEWGAPGSPFDDSNIKSVVIEDGVTAIGNYAFYYCDGLTSVTIPDSVTTIGDRAFYYCDSLTSVIIPDSVITIGDYAFYSCDSLTSVTIPDSVTTIGKSAFSSCDGFTSITIPDSVTTIEDYAFRFCNSLTSVTIPDSVITIGSSAFSSCGRLTSITVDDDNANYCSVDGVLFDKNKKILIQYPIGNERTAYIIPYGVTTIGEHAFYPCDSLTSVTIPDSVTTIGDYAFLYCTGLTSVTIPDSVTAIGDYAFRSCDSLTSVIIPDSVTTIGEAAFYSCRSLTSVTIPDSVITIGSSAFSSCYGLTSVTIPDSVTTIGDSAFYSCLRLTDVYYKGTKTQWNKISIGLGNSDLTSATIHCEKKEQLGKPAKITAIQSTTAVKITWTAVEGANVYRVYQETSSGWKKLGDVARLDGTITKLAAGTKYTFAVKAGKTKNGATEWADGYTTISTATKTVKPASVKAAQNTSAIKLSWNKVAGATGYRIYYKSSGNWKVTVSSTTATSHTFKNLKAGAKYTFAVRPYIITTSGVVWGEYTTYTASTLPATVTVKATSSSTGKIKLSWNAVNGSEGYQLWYKKGNGSYKLYKVVSNSTKGYSFSNIKSGTTYTFAVRAGIRTSGGNIFGAYKTATVKVK